MGFATRPFLVGIAGGTGSGKTLLTTTLAKKYAHIGAHILDHDSYYRDRSHLSVEERNLVNYDEAVAIDHDLILHHLKQLIAGQSIEKPRYNFATHTRLPRGEPVSPKPMVFVEGLFALWDSRARSLMDLKVFVDADPDVRFIGRRDVLERGRTVDSVVDQCVRRSRRGQHRIARPHCDKGRSSYCGMLFAVDIPRRTEEAGLGAASHRAVQCDPGSVEQRAI